MATTIEPMTACEDYRIEHGCNENCPLLKAGECDAFDSVEDFKLRGKKPKRVPVYFSLTQEQAEVIEKKAISHGLSIGSYAKYSMLYKKEGE